MKYVKTKKISAAFLILCGLLFSSFSFYVWAENSSTGASNVFLDSDQDGLTDQEEKLYATDPHNPDTDGDGYSDGAEVRAGYNPLKPAPGDKIGFETNSTDNSQRNDNSQNNLTDKVAQKLSSLANTTDTSKQNLNLEDLNQMVSDALSTQNQPLQLPEVNKDDFKIKKQNYDKYSQDKAAEMKKEDFENYVAQVYYILASNSPQPLASGTDISSVITQTVTQITSAMTLRDPSSLDALSQSGQKIMDNLKDVEVPEDLVDLHMKAMQYALYAESLKDYLKPNPNDPLSDIVNFSRISAFVQSLISFSTEAENKAETYGINYSDLQQKINNYGIPAPDLSDLTNNVTPSATSSPVSAADSTIDATDSTNNQ